MQIMDYKKLEKVKDIASKADINKAAFDYVSDHERIETIVNIFKFNQNNFPESIQKSQLQKDKNELKDYLKQLILFVVSIVRYSKSNDIDSKTVSDIEYGYNLIRRVLIDCSRLLERDAQIREYAANNARKSFQRRFEVGLSKLHKGISPIGSNLADKTKRINDGEKILKDFGQIFSFKESEHSDAFIKKITNGTLHTKELKAVESLLKKLNNALKEKTANERLKQISQIAQSKGPNSEWLCVGLRRSLVRILCDKRKPRNVYFLFKTKGEHDNEYLRAIPSSPW